MKDQFATRSQPPGQADRGNVTKDAGRGMARKRTLRAAWTAGTSIVARVAGMLASAVSVPILLEQLGAERYGVWMTLSGFFTVLSFADMGLGNGLVNILARSWAQDRWEDAAAAITNAFAVLSGIAGVLAVTAVVVIPNVSWAAFFGAHSLAAPREVDYAVGAMAVCFVAGLTTNIMPRIYNAVQAGFVANAWSTGASFLAIACILMANSVGFQLGIPLTAVLVFGLPVLGNVTSGIVAFVGKYRPLLPRRQLISRGTSLLLLREGLKFFVLQLCYALVFSSDNLIIARSLGPQEVTTYSTCARLFSLSSVVFSAVIATLWPAYTEAVARQDVQWASRVLKLTVGLAIAYGFVVGGGLIWFGPLILRLWTHGRVTPPDHLLVALAVGTLFTVMAACLSTFLNALGALRVQAIASFVLIFVCIPAKILACHRYGSVGLVWGTTISYAIVFVMPLAREVVARLRLMQTRIA